MYHNLVENFNLQNIENDFQRLLHIETLHPDHVVPKQEQNCDTGSQNWILNRDRQYPDTSPCFAPLEAGLTDPQPACLYKSSIITSCTLRSW
jgi:hypothetical protein